jgi:hypothetical protein
MSEKSEHIDKILLRDRPLEHFKNETMVRFIDLK